MKRTIKFRAKTVHDGEWIKGSLIISTVAGEKHYHIQEEYTSGHRYVFEIDPDTVGQFTGLQDKNGKDIFEGDVLSKTDDARYVVYWSSSSQGWTSRYEVAIEPDDIVDIIEWEIVYARHGITGAVLYGNIVSGTVHDKTPQT